MSEDSPNIRWPEYWAQVSFDLLFENVTSSSLKLPQSEYAAEGRYPVIDQGEQFVGGFTDDESLVHPGPVPAIVFGDHTRCVKFTSTSFVQGADGVKVLVPSPSAYAKYAYWVLKSADIPSKGYARHYSILRKLKFPLPPKNEQRLIVEAIESYLTRLDEAVETLKRVKRNLKRYRGSVLRAAVEGRLVPTEAELARAVGRAYEPASLLLERVLAQRGRRWEEAELVKMKANGKSPSDDKWKAKYDEPVPPDTAELPELPEGWSWATWEQVSQRVTVGHVGKMKDEYLEAGVPFLRGGNVRPNRYEPADLKFVSSAFHKQLAKSALRPGDLLIVRSGAVGTSCVVPDTLPEANCSDLVIVKQPSGVRAEFGAYYMNSLAQATVRSQQVGVALIHFNTQSAAALPIPVPPAEEQDRIVAFVETTFSVIDEVEADVALNIRRADRLRQAVLKWAFEGHLVDQDSYDEPASALLERIRVERKSSDGALPKARRRRKAESETT